MRGDEGRALYRLEIKRALTSPFFLVVVGIGILLATADAAIFKLASQRILERQALYGSVKDCGLTAVSCFIGWLGASHAAFARLFFTLLPLLALLPYSCSRISDKRSGLLAQVALRAGRVEAEKAKTVAVFLASGLVAVLPLLWSIFLGSCLEPARTPQMRDLITLESGVTTDVLGHSLFYTRPVLFVLLWACIDFLLMGLWGTTVLAITRLVDNRVLLVVGAYLFQMGLAYLTGDFAEALGRPRIVLDLFALAYPVGDDLVTLPTLAAAMFMMAAISATLFVRLGRRDYV